MILSTKRKIILFATIVLFALSLYLFYQTILNQNALFDPNRTLSTEGVLINEIDAVTATALDGTEAIRRGNTLRYGPKPWQHIKSRTVLVGKKVKTCIWIHPETKPLSITWKLHKSQRVTISFLPVDTIDRTAHATVTYELRGEGEDEKFSLRLNPKNDKITNRFTNGPYDTIKITLTAAKDARNHWCMEGSRW